MDRGDLVAERGSRKIQDLLVEDRQREKGERQGDEESRQENRRPGKGEICMRLDVKEGKKNLSRLARQRAGKDVQQVLWTMMFAFCDL